MKKKILAATVFLPVAAIAVTLLGSPVVQSAGPADPNREWRISESDATRIVSDLTGVPDADLTVNGSIDGAVSTAYTVEGPDVVAAVDVATGRIGMLTINGHVPSSARVRISEGNALAIAKSFAAKARIDVGGRDVSVRLVDHDYNTEYVVMWTKRERGALVPATTSISVNPDSGEVFSIVDISRPYDAPEEAAVSRDAAVHAAIQILDDTAVLQDSNLVVRFDLSGSQGLHWALKFTEGDPDGHVVGRVVFVDAMSGQVVD